MSSSSLKARDVEALAYLQGSQHAQSRSEGRRQVRLPQMITAGATAIMLAAAALAWMRLRG